MRKATCLWVLAAGVLLASCGGKSDIGQMNPDANLSAAKKGFLGSIGAEIMEINNKDYALFALIEELNKKEVHTDQEIENAKRWFDEKGEKLFKEHEAAEEKWKTRFPELEPQVMGKVLETEIADGTPLELLQPFTITTFKPDVFYLEVKIKFLKGCRNMSRDEINAKPKGYYDVKAILMDGSNNLIDTLTIDAPYYYDGTPEGKKGSRSLVGLINPSVTGVFNQDKEGIIKTSKILAAKHAIIVWEHADEAGEM